MKSHKNNKKDIFFIESIVKAVLGCKTLLSSLKKGAKRNFLREKL
jgi:hypothetical protein